MGCFWVQLRHLPLREAHWALSRRLWRGSHYVLQLYEFEDAKCGAQSQQWIDFVLGCSWAQQVWTCCPARLSVHSIVVSTIGRTA